MKAITEVVCTRDMTVMGMTVLSTTGLGSPVIFWLAIAVWQATVF